MICALITEYYIIERFSIERRIVVLQTCVRVANIQTFKTRWCQTVSTKLLHSIRVCCLLPFQYDVVVLDSRTIIYVLFIARDSRSIHIYLLHNLCLIFAFPKYYFFWHDLVSVTFNSWRNYFLEYRNAVVLDVLCFKVFFF